MTNTDLGGISRSTLNEAQAVGQISQGKWASEERLQTAQRKYPQSCWGSLSLDEDWKARPGDKRRTSGR